MTTQTTDPKTRFNQLIEQCRAGNWPTREAAMSIINAADKTLMELVCRVGSGRLVTNYPQIPTAPLPSQVHETERDVRKMDAIPAGPDAMQLLEQEYEVHKAIIERLGVSKADYIRSAQKNKLQKLGIDSRFLEVGRK